jgi:hypothetical protein
MLELRNGTRKIDKQFNHSHKPAQTKQQVGLVRNTLVLGHARMSHGQTRTHKIHHGSNLGEATTFPLMVYSVFGHLRRSAPPRSAPRFPGLISERSLIPLSKCYFF